MIQKNNLLQKYNYKQLTQKLLCSRDLPPSGFAVMYHIPILLLLPTSVGFCPSVIFKWMRWHADLLVCEISYVASDGNY